MNKSDNDYDQIKKDLEVINNSMASVSSNIQQISKKHKFFIYGLGVMSSISQAKKIVEKKPIYLLKEEIDYLNYFIKIFEKSNFHGGYKLTYSNWLDIYKKGLNSLENRTNKERIRIVEFNKSLEIESMIQLTFKLINSNFLLVREKINKLQELNLFSQNKIKSFMRGIGQIVNHLTRGYYFEFAYITGSKDFNLSDLKDFIEGLNEFNNSLNNGDSFISFFENFMIGNNEAVHA